MRDENEIRRAFRLTRKFVDDGGGLNYTRDDQLKILVCFLVLTWVLVEPGHEKIGGLLDSLSLDVWKIDYGDNGQLG